MGAEGEAARRDAAPAVDDGRERLRAAVVATACIVAICALGSSVYFTNDPYLILAPLAGVVAALGTRRVADAAPVALVGVVAGTACAAGVSAGPWASPAIWLPSVLPVAAVSALIALAVRWLLGASAGLTGLIALAGVILLVGGAWLGAVSASSYAPEGKRSLAQMLSEKPEFAPLSVDEGVYLHYVWRLRQGEAYYPAAVRTLEEGNRVRGVTVDLSNPLSYRLPTLYRLLARVPAGMSMVLLFMLVGSVATVSTYAMARRFLAVAPSFVAAAAVAAQSVGYSGQLRIMGTEVWAGFLGLTAVALFVLAVSGEASGRSRLFAVALAFALAAALVRELALAFLLLGLAALLAEKELRSWRVWGPWALGIAVALAAYAAHWALASAAIREAGVAASGLQASWLRPFGTPLLGGWYLTAGVVGWKMPAMAGLFALGLAGALLLRAPVAGRVMLAGTVAGGCALLLLLGPSGVADAHGLAPAYWVSLIAPTVAASAVLVMARLPGPWRAAASSETSRDGDETA